VRRRRRRATAARWATAADGVRWWTGGDVEDGSRLPGPGFSLATGSVRLALICPSRELLGLGLAGLRVVLTDLTFGGPIGCSGRPQFVQGGVLPFLDDRAREGGARPGAKGQ